MKINIFSQIRFPHSSSRSTAHRLAHNLLHSEHDRRVCVPELTGEGFIYNIK